MIAFLKGKIINKSENGLIIEVNNVGYKVFVNSKILSEFNVGEDIQIYTHQHVREDALDLYGFRSLGELELFELLLSISGIGPKSALGVLVVSSINDIKDSISRGDSSLLTKVSGIGRKTAERVVLELRDKMDYVVSIGAETGKAEISAASDEIDALVALGYSLQQAREALRGVDPAIKDSGERIKQALKQMQN